MEYNSMVPVNMPLNHVVLLTESNRDLTEIEIPPSVAS